MTRGATAVDKQLATVSPLRVLIAAGKVPCGHLDLLAGAWDMIPAVVSAANQFATRRRRRGPSASGEVLSVSLVLFSWLFRMW